jgi:hypothetical protein
VPSEDIATEDQLAVVLALVGIQLVAELVERKIGPPPTAARSFVPSAEEAIDVQLSLGAVVMLQFWAGARREPIKSAASASDDVKMAGALIE